jgi:hypothetical protein
MVMTNRKTMKENERKKEMNRIVLEGFAAMDDGLGVSLQ